MGVLQDFRREEIESLLAGARGAELLDNFGSLKGVLNAALSGTTLSRNAARGLGGIEVFKLAAKLRDLVQRGSITLEEANGYFGGSFGYATLFSALPTTRAQQEAGKTEVELVEEGRTQADAATVIASEQAEAQAAEGSGGAQPVVLELGAMPAVYRPEAVAAAVRSALDEVELRLSELRAGKIAFAPGSIDGAVLRPGTVSSSKLSAEDLSRRIQQWPHDKHAIEVDIDHDATVDRWVDSGSLAFAGGGARPVRGPGRVWRARALRLPPDYRRPTGGPMRYRLVRPGMELGLMSITRIDAGSVHAGNAAAQYHLVYGVVIRGLRYFGDRPPEHLAALWVGAHPGSSATIQATPANTVGTAQLFHGAARSTFQAGGYRLLEPFSRLSTSNLDPSVGDCDGFVGFRVGLITGQGWREVYPQLNGKPNTYSYLTGNPTPRVSDTAVRVPTSLVHDEAPCPASVVTGSATSPMVGTYRSDAVTGTWENVIQGVPFRPEDCALLAPDEGSKTFSVLVEARLDRVVSGTTMDAWIGATARDQRVGAWWTSGVRVAPAGQRRTLLDVVVW